MCAHQGVRNVSFSENFAYGLNDCKETLGIQSEICLTIGILCRSNQIYIIKKIHRVWKILKYSKFILRASECNNRSNK